eukprot:Hpha_TRINITY_DN16054_c0_g2::TRINITY_DN16054_c0_g2_i1::g.122268::m.122268/K02873/RP-L13e, RPL13; large subunit ribosomal protein L13e
MGKRHNNAIPRVHFRKHWNPCSSQRGHIKTFFSQPKQKEQRRIRRAAKAAKVFPRPVSGLVRPLVQACSVRYSMKTRSGRGFTLAEVKAAGLNPKYARTIGVAVDHRRQNHSEESLARNTERLKAYLEKLVLFPLRKQNDRKAGKWTKVKRERKEQGPVKAASAEEKKAVVQDTSRFGVLPVRASAPKEAPRAPTATEKTRKVYNYLRALNRNEKFIGVRSKRIERKAAKQKEADLGKGKK